MHLIKTPSKPICRLGLLLLLSLSLIGCSSKEPSLSLHWKQWASNQANIWLADAQALQESVVAYCNSNTELESTRLVFSDLLGQWAFINGYPYKAIDEQALAFSLYFWPDKRNVTEIRLNARVQSGEIVALSEYDQLIAAEKGMPALEWLLFKEDLSQEDRCTSLVAVSAIYLNDVRSLHQYHQTAGLILDEWTVDADVIAGRSIALNLLYSQISRLESHLRQSRDEQGMWITYMAEGWRSENTWPVYQQSLTSLHEMLVHTGDTSTISSENKARLNDYSNRAAQIVEQISVLSGHQENTVLLDNLHELLIELSNFLETDLAENFGILIGFNNFDGD